MFLLCRSIEPKRMQTKLDCDLMVGNKAVLHFLEIAKIATRKGQRIAFQHWI
jgi:hypothetical protein